MANQTINIGATANDGTGDALRTAFDKINDNFTELYAVSPAGTDNNIAFSGNKIISEDSGGNIELDPQGTGKVIIATAAKLRFTDHVDNGIAYVDASGDVQFKSTLTYDGTTFKLSDLTANRMLFTTTGGGLTNDANFTFNGTAAVLTGSLAVDGITIRDNNIESTASNANLVLVTSGTGLVEIDSNLDMNSNQIVNLATPTSSTDATTKAYVDSVVGTVTVADESSDTTCFPIFAVSATGNLSPKTGTNLTFNSNTGLLTATLLAGALTGNVTGTASIATSVTVADESSDTTCFPLFATAATGNLPPKSGSNLTFNSSTGLLTATLLAGNLTGNVTGTASIATNVTVADESTDTACNVVFVTAATGNLPPKTGTNLTFNSNTGLLTATLLAGNLTGNVTGTASIATTVTVTDNESTNEANVILFAAGAAGSGNLGVEADGNMTYNPSTGVITATGFAGALTGNVTGTASIATTVTVADESSDTTCFPLFATAASGNLAPKSGTNLAFNSGSGELAMTSILGGGLFTEHGAGAVATSFAPITRRFTQNGVIITKIHFDLTGLGGKGGAANDVIGLPAGGNAFIGRNVVSNNGVIYRAELACIELAAAASGSATVDIDIATNASGTLAYDGAAGTAKLFNTGGMVAGQELSNITPAITGNDYFYLVEADTAATDGVYNAGQFILTLYGHAIS